MGLSRKHVQCRNQSCCQSLSSLQTESPATAQFGKSKPGKKHAFSYKRLETRMCEPIVSCHINSCRRYTEAATLVPYSAGVPRPGCQPGKKDYT